MDARCSRVVEKLLDACVDDDLATYVRGVTAAPTDFFTLCKSLFGSRVAERAQNKKVASENVWLFYTKKRRAN